MKEQVLSREQAQVLIYLAQAVQAAQEQFKGAQAAQKSQVDLLSMAYGFTADKVQFRQDGDSVVMYEALSPDGGGDERPHS